MLVEHGADVSACNNLGLSPSLLASRSGNVEDVQILLEYGVDATARDGDKSTARCGGDMRRSLACLWSTVRTRWCRIRMG
jgi:ankyrin repeat protein